VILPQAASSSPASYLSSLGSGVISSAASAGAGDSAFQSLLQTTVSGFPANAPHVALTSSAYQAPGLITKAGTSDEDQDQQNVGNAQPAAASDQSPNPILLALFGLMPVEASAAVASSSNPVTVLQAAHGQAASDGSHHVDLNKINTDVLINPLATEDAVRGIVNSERTAGGMPVSTAAAAPQGPVQRFEAASSSSGTAMPMQPVFTLAIRPECAVPQTLAPEQSGTQQTATTANNASLSPVSQPQSDQTFPGIPVSGGSAAPESVENTSPASDIGSSAAVIPAVTMAKPDLTGSGLDNKSSGDQPGDRQATAAMIETAVMPGAASGASAQFQVPESRPVTEYVHADETASAHANTPLTEIRLQVDGAANQHIDVRLSQQADGLRVTLRSSDPALTQSLQEHVPELATRLEQHHYQTEVLLPEGSPSVRFGQAHTSANLQHDLESRQHGSAGQGNPQNRQNQQQRQQRWNEEEQFQDLVG
jgi:hypothetical protein